jgi:hypothetical protein
MFGFDFAEKCKHVPFGTVNFGKEILATRAGKVILLDDPTFLATEVGSLYCLN